jgi:glucose/arabinose dehydrogenase
MAATGPVRRWAGCLTALALIGGLTFAASTDAGARPAGAASASSSRPVVAAQAVRLVPKVIPSGFDVPTHVTSAPEGRDRLYVVEQRGVVTAVQGSKRWRYLDLRSKVLFGGEQGMVGLAFSPAFRQSRRLFVTFTRDDGALVLGRLKAKRATSKRVEGKTFKRLLVVPHPTYTNHNGGSMAFGPDGNLYLGTGDGGGGGNPLKTAESKKSLSGKILRLDVDRSCGSKRYCIPKSNPYRGKKAGKNQILHLGVRNPWKISFDPDGRLWVADVGQDKYEEVSRLKKNSPGRNLGWACFEGKHRYDRSRCRSGKNYTMPKIEIGHPAQASSPEMEGESVTGGYVYRGSKFASVIGGAYVFSDWSSGNVWTYSGGAVRNIGSLPRVTSFGEDDKGELYAVTYTGSLVRLAFRAA